jgi:hypothetical protein
MEVGGGCRPWGGGWLAAYPNPHDAGDAGKCILSVEYAAKIPLQHD